LHFDQNGLFLFT